MCLQIQLKECGFNLPLNKAKESRLNFFFFQSERQRVEVWTLTHQLTPQTPMKEPSLGSLLSPVWVAGTPLSEPPSLPLQGAEVSSRGRNEMPGYTLWDVGGSSTK